MKITPRMAAASGPTVLTALMLAEDFTPIRAAIWIPLWAPRRWRVDLRRDSRPPHQGGTVIEYLSRAEVAEPEGLSINTIDGYVRRGYMPDPDARIGRNYGWLPETIDKWSKNRPGRGARIDLQDN